MAQRSSKKPVQQAGTPAHLPRPDFRYPGEIGRTYLDSDPPQFPQPVQVPEGAPNILLILIDDCGFGQYGTFGGGTRACASPARRGGGHPALRIGTQRARRARDAGDCSRGHQ